MLLIVIHLFVSVCRAVTTSFDRLKNHGSRLGFPCAAAVIRQPYRPSLMYHKFSRFARKGNEIHAFRQC